MKKEINKYCGKIYMDKYGNKRSICVNFLPCNGDHLIAELEPACSHEFRYSHIEYPPAGMYTVIPPNKEVVICVKCGELRKTIIC